MFANSIILAVVAFRFIKNNMNVFNWSVFDLPTIHSFLNSSIHTHIVKQFFSFILCF